MPSEQHCLFLFTAPSLGSSGDHEYRQHAGCLFVADQTQSEHIGGLQIMAVDFIDMLIHTLCAGTESSWFYFPQW